MSRGDPLLGGYLERIGYDGPVAPTLECLTAIHRHQALTVPYENLDVQLKVTVDQDPAAIYDKLVAPPAGRLVLRAERPAAAVAGASRVRRPAGDGRRAPARER